MSDDLTIPDFLRRENTPGQRARVKRLVRAVMDREIKNPPKRASRQARSMGPIFGTKLKGW
jgi:hypothetical protein